MGATLSFQHQNLEYVNEERRFAYRELFRHELEPGEIDEIRKATNGNFAFGFSRFVEEISEMLGCRVTSGKAGRPRKILLSVKENKRGLSPITKDEIELPTGRRVKVKKRGRPLGWRKEKILFYSDPNFLDPNFPIHML